MWELMKTGQQRLMWREHPQFTACWFGSQRRVRGREGCGKMLGFEGHLLSRGKLEGKG